MANGGVDYQPVLDVINSWVTGRPKTIIVVFFVVTALFALGLPYIEIAPGEGGFTEGTDEQEALDAVNEEFDRPFAEGAETTQLIQRNENVLSREGVLRMLRLLQRVENDASLRVREGSAPAQGVATVLNNDAETREQQIRAVEAATDAEVRSAARTLLDRNPSVKGSLSNDLNEETPSASASIAIVEHEIPTGDGDELERIQTDMQDTTDTVGGDVVVFGSAIFDSEFEQALVDSLSLMVPAVIVLILFFLLFAYRDPIDLVLGLVSLFLAVIWTFGFVGHARIPFNQMMVAVPPLLLAVGIDFGIHAVNRYREERVTGKDPYESMIIANEQLVVAFFIVTGTTAIGFGANMTSDLPAIFDFGFVASLGIIFTFLIFGIFLPAAKLYLDELREGTWIPEFGTQPLGDEDSPLGRLLPVSAHVARRAPVVMLVVILLMTAGAGYVGTGVDTEFDDEEFLPYEDVPAYIDVIPEPLGPGDYQVRGLVTFLGDNFESGESNEVTVYVEGPIYQNHVLESVYRAGQEPPPAIVTDGRRAESESILDVMDEYAEEDDEFAALVARSDLTGNGIPDQNVRRIYEELLASPYEEEALTYITEDLQSMRVIYSVDAEASQQAITTDTRSVADRHWLDATATGDTIIFETVTELLLASAIVSLSVALGLTVVFLILIYWLLEGRPSLGLANTVPIVSTVAVLAATMAVLDIPFNALTATILSITIGIGIDYSVHITHRFIDEYNAGQDAHTALVRTLRGTGGGITGSMITTAGGVGALVLSVTPMLAQFGVLMSLSVILSYLGSIIVLPPALLVWERVFG